MSWSTKVIEVIEIIKISEMSRIVIFNDILRL
jgi:hypothetical protein